MTDEQKTILAESGVDLETAFARLNNHDELLEKHLKKIPNDPSFSQLRGAFKTGDIQDAFIAAHTLKGTANNLYLKALAESLEPLIESLKAKDFAGAKKKFPQVSAAYEKIIEAIGHLD